jgi:hypothetical protein
MAILSKKLTQVLYLGVTDLPLANLPAGVKSAIKSIRQVNSAGTGYVSHNPASGVNALTTAVAPTAALVSQYIVETISGTPNVDLGADFGVVVARPVRLVATFDQGLTARPLPLKVLSAAEAGTYVLDAAYPVTGLTNLSYQKNGTAVSLSTTVGVALNTTDTLTITGTTQAGTQGQLVLIKQ